jgi:hypothetical protein
VRAQGFDILVSDVDTAWMRDPLPFLLRYPDADILTSSDHLSNTVDVRCASQTCVCVRCAGRLLTLTTP